MNNSTIVVKIQNYKINKAIAEIKLNIENQFTSNIFLSTLIAFSYSDMLSDIIIEEII